MLTILITFRKFFFFTHFRFEAYQIKGPEYTNRLLALVSSQSGGTFAIISFSYLRTPLTSVNELIINKVFAIDHNFQLRQGEKLLLIKKLQTRFQIQFQYSLTPLLAKQI